MNTYWKSRLQEQFRTGFAAGAAFGVLVGFVLGMMVDSKVVEAATLSFRFTAPLAQEELIVGSYCDRCSRYGQIFHMGPALTLEAFDDTLQRQLSILSREGGKVELRMATVESGPAGAGSPKGPTR